MNTPFKRPRRELGLAPTVRLHIAGEHVDSSNEMDANIDVVNPPVPSHVEVKPTFAERVRTAIAEHIVWREIGMSLYRVSLALRISRCDRQYTQLNRDMDFHEAGMIATVQTRRYILDQRRELRERLRELGGQ
jgi:hypothetical protein